MAGSTGGSTKQRLLFRSAVKALLKVLNNITQRPQQTKLRKLRMQNPVVVKYVVGLKGGMTFMEAIGFQQVSNGKSLLSLSDATMATALTTTHLLPRAIKLLKRELAAAKEGTDSPSKANPKQRCQGGCGFWGEEKMDYYCSVCHKKKFEGISTPSSTSTTEDSKPTGPPVKCGGGCGFFGSDKFEGMCSVCFKKEEKKAVPRKRWRTARRLLRAVYLFKKGAKPREQQTNRSRCWHCKRKVGIVGIECRCGYVFCGKHRYADEHKCDFDHRKRHQDNLRMANKIVKAEKFDKIQKE